MEDLRNKWDDIVECLAAALKAAPPTMAIPAAQRYQQLFAAIEISKLAEQKQSGVSDRARRTQATAGGTRSKAAASKATKRADAVDENPDLANEVERGELGNEQLDAIAHASEKSDGDAANDPELLDEVKNAPPEDASKICQRWLDRRDGDATASRHERQRARRGVWFGYHQPSGCEQMTMRGDRETIGEVRSFLQRRASELYRSDGGRDLSVDQHPRTKTQRLYDAAVTSLTTARPATATGAPSPRALLHIPITVDSATGDLIEAMAPDGHGLLPRSVFERYACLGEVAITAFSEDGRTLRHGRTKRYATDDQWVALVARDGGCVRCSAAPSMCVAHHLDPFNAPIRGKTNVDEMALVCDDCHHQIHDNNVTLYWQLGPPQPDGTPTWLWKTRPATPSEIPDRRSGADGYPDAA